jgi:hypothetical protein
MWSRRSGRIPAGQTTRRNPYSHRLELLRFTKMHAVLIATTNRMSAEHGRVEMFFSGYFRQSYDELAADARALSH